ncbi:MAG: ABC-F family ATP-binding cassette domain-containing protein [Verrucomicrobiota bacterium]
MSTIINATGISVRYNDQLLLDGATLTLEDSDRVGMVGRNGCGKSTFLRILAGLQAPDTGEVTRRRDLVVGYLPQKFELDLTLTVRENIRGGAQHVLDLIHEFESLPATSRKHAELEQRIQTLDGWGLDHRIETAMAHLNCPSNEQRMDTLSGGELRRVALCRAIISRPDLLILDEPTNHLDTESIEWVADFLEEYPAAFLLVTHDRYFLDRVTNRMVELSNGTFYSHAGNYTEYLLAKAERDAAMEVIEHKRQMFLKRELEWVRRGPMAQRSKAKNRFERYYDVAAQGPPALDGTVDLVIPPPPPLGNRVAELVKVGMELGGKRLFANLNLTFAANQRMGITGRNGLGKTTLLKIILGQLEPTEGSVKLGQLTRFNYVDQGRLQLNEERTVLEEVSDGTEFVLWGETRISLRAYLKRFLFSDERIASQVKHLSGGERSRLLLARILKMGGNFLILDEPTNDLDLATLRVLEEALVAFPGVVMVVSHDRYFLNRVCTDILAFEGDAQVTHSVGDYDYYAEKRRRQLQETSANRSKAAPATHGWTAEAAEARKKPTPNRPRKLSFKETRELEGIEAVILAAEENVSRIEALFLETDFHRKYGQRMEELNAELAADKARITQLYERWQELEAIRAGAAPAE